MPSPREPAARRLPGNPSPRRASPRPTGPLTSRQQQIAACPARPSRPAAQQPAAAAPAPVQPAAPPAPSERSAQPAAQPDPVRTETRQPTAESPVPAAGPGGDVEVLRRAWPDVLQTLSKIKRSTWALVEPNAQVGQFDGHVLTLAFTTSGLAGAFGRADHSENLRQAIHKTVGIDCQINAVSGGASSSASSEPNPKAPGSRETSATPKAPVGRETQATSADVAWGLAPAATGADAAPGRTPAPAPSADAPAPQPGAGPAPVRPTAAGAGSAVDAGTAMASGAANPDVRPAPAAPSPQDDVSGSYSYPDDDWGPPLDEDAPPMEEEPPMDWAPSAPAQSRPVQPGPASAGTPARPAPDGQALKPATGQEVIRGRLFSGRAKQCDHATIRGPAPWKRHPASGPWVPSRTWASRWKTRTWPGSQLSRNPRRPTTSLPQPSSPGPPRLHRTPRRSSPPKPRARQRSGSR